MVKNILWGIFAFLILGLCGTAVAYGCSPTFKHKVDQAFKWGEYRVVEENEEDEEDNSNNGTAQIRFTDSGNVVIG